MPLTVLAFKRSHVYQFWPNTEALRFDNGEFKVTDSREYTYLKSLKQYLKTEQSAFLAFNSEDNTVKEAGLRFICPIVTNLGKV